MKATKAILLCALASLAASTSEDSVTDKVPYAEEDEVVDFIQEGEDEVTQKVGTRPDDSEKSGSKEDFPSPDEPVEPVVR